ncbi:MAG TPA: group 1 truncated hemoglobin [Halococcus sp.]|nr:group 1 truncated hemoglobin [Halococcus sp.]
MSETTLYERLGGKDAIETAVDEFYDRVLSDERLVDFFEDTPTTELRAHQTQFLSSVTGGPVEYSGDNMAEAHAQFDIDHTDYTLVAAHLEDALAVCDVPAADRREVLAAVEELREPIVAS